MRQFGTIEKILRVARPGTIECQLIISQEIMRFQNEANAYIAGRILYTHDVIDDLRGPNPPAGQIEIGGDSDSPT
jgi:hypothetical protein